MLDAPLMGRDQTPRPYFWLIWLLVRAAFASVMRPFESMLSTASYSRSMLAKSAAWAVGAVGAAGAAEGAGRINLAMPRNTSS